MVDLKKQYEEARKEFDRASSYMDNTSIPYSKRIKHEKKFLELLDKCKTLYNALKEEGQHAD